jgi:arabinogalactan oligomer / maltooligosaccharide transport system permease protein
VAVTALFSFMTAWNEFIIAATFMNREEMYTAPGGPAVLRRRLLAAVGLFRRGLDHRRDPGGVLFMFLQKYLVSGLTAGAVKG